MAFVSHYFTASDNQKLCGSERMPLTNPHPPFLFANYICSLEGILLTVNVKSVDFVLMVTLHRCHSFLKKKVFMKMNIVISTPFKTNSWDQRLIFFFLHLTVVLWLTLSWMNHYVAVGLHLGLNTCRCQWTKYTIVVKKKKRNSDIIISSFIFSSNQCNYWLISCLLSCSIFDTAEKTLSIN